MDDRAIGENTGESTANAFSSSAPASLSPAPYVLKISPRIAEWPTPEEGRYRIDGEFARGGRGRILRAYDARLDRVVAIKELLRDRVLAQARFVREALVTARLQHPAVIPIYDVGRWPSGAPFYAMRMVFGRSLAQTFGDKPSLEARLELLPALARVADAMAYAHQQHVIHRDLKPANILLGPFGEVMIIDWGLATDLRAHDDRPREMENPYQLAALDLTLSGTVIGTPQYMPPEQAHGYRADALSDVYALGAILYHVLAGAPPYQGKSSAEVVTQLSGAPPVPVEKREPLVPRDLAAIVRRAMAREPPNRYPDANAFAEELKRFQTGQLVRAYHYPKPALAQRWLRRHRAPVLVATVLVALSSLIGLAALRRILDERNALILLQAQSRLEKDPTAAVAWLKTHPAVHRAGNAVRNIALQAEAEGISRHLFRRDSSQVSYAAFSPDGHLLATAVRGNAVRVVDADSGARLAELGAVGLTQEILFSSNGDSLLLSNWNNSEVTWWNFRTGAKEVWRVDSPRVDDILFSSDGKWIVASTRQNDLQVRNRKTGETRRLSGHQGRVNALKSLPNAQVASSSEDGTVRLWDLRQETSRVLTGAASALNALAVSEDGKTVAAADGGGTVHFWDVASSKHWVAPQGEALQHIAFSPDATRLASAASSGTLRILDCASGATVSLLGHTGAALAAKFSPDGQQLASGGFDGTVRVWDLVHGTHRILRGHTAPVHQVLYSPNAQHLISSANDGTVRVWLASLGPEETGRALLGHTDQVQHVAFSPTGRRLATASRDSTVRIWDASSGESRVLGGHRDLVLKVQFSPNERTLVSGGFDHLARVWDLATGGSRPLDGHAGTVADVAFSHGGNLLATAGSEGTVRIWDARTQTLLRTVSVDGAIRDIGFSAGDDLLAIAGTRGLTLWSMDSGALRSLGASEGTSYPAFSSDGRRLAALSQGVPTLWDVDSGQSRNSARPGHRALSLALSPDGRSTASGFDDGAVVTWSFSRKRSIELTGHSASVLAVAFSPDGTLVASGSADRTVRLWSAADGALRAIYPQGDHVLAISFAPDGQLLAAAGASPTVKLWRVRSSSELARRDPISHFSHWAAMKTTAVLEEGLNAATP